MAQPQVRDEDELEQLPPLDGDPTDQPEAEADYGDLLEEAKEQATLDDVTGEDDPADTSDLDLDDLDRESGWLGEAGEAPDLDFAGLDIAIIDFGKEPPHLDEVDETGMANEDFGFVDAPERGGLDVAEEGPIDADEELREEDLPALDADEEGELDDAALVDAAFASEEPLGVPWAAQPWPRVGSPLALAGATAVACAARGALVAGRSEGAVAGLIRVDLEGTCERLPADGLDAAEVRALAVERNLVAAVVQGGRLFVSRDAGKRFVPVAAPIADGMVASDAVFASGWLWVRTRTGGLLVDPTLAESQQPAGGTGVSGEQRTIERCPIPGIAAALTCDLAHEIAAVAALVVDDTGQPTTLVRALAGASVKREAIDGPEVRSPVPFAVRGEHVAYAPRRGGIVRRTGGTGWAVFTWEGRVTALVFVDDAGTTVAATYSDSDDTTALVRVDPAGSASVVARIGAVQADAESDGCVVAMAHDEARGVVWVGGAFGVAAFAIR